MAPATAGAALRGVLVRPPLERATAAAKMPYSAAPFAHDPEKCARFSDKIMRKIKEIDHDPFRQKRIML
jgi:hypothetical protein